jgi:hypothetical protein
MATIEYWIQLESRPWDACPNNIDHMSGQDIKTITFAAAGDYGYHGGSAKNKTGMYGIIHVVA